MQVFNNIYNISSVNHLKNLREKHQINHYLTNIQADTFTSSKHNNSNIGLINFCGLAHPLKIDPLEKMFQELYEFNGNNVEFAKLSFRKVRDYLGLTDVFTKDLSIINLPQRDGTTALAESLWWSGDIGLDEEVLKTSTKDSILDSIRHEFEHYLQHEKMMRSEDIGIEKFIELDNQKELCKHSADLFEAQMTDERCMNDGEFLEWKNSIVDRDFWQNVIAKRGIIKSDTPESREALSYLNASLKYPNKHSYVELYHNLDGIPIKNPKYLMFIDQYRNAKIDFDYYTSILETNARNVGSEIKKQYQEFIYRKTGQNISTAKEKEPFNLEELTKIKRFDEIFEQKFGQYNLPENFKAFMHAVIGCDAHHNTTEINNKLLNADKDYILFQLNLYEGFLKKGQINMRSQEEIDRVNKFIQEYRLENAS